MTPYAPDTPSKLECGSYKDSAKLDEPIYVVVEENRHNYAYFPLFWSTDLYLVQNFIEKNENVDIQLTYHIVKKLVEW